MVYSDYQIGVTLHKAGFRGEGIRKGIAVVLAESGGDSRAVGDGGKSRGWWQIYKPAHPTVTDACAFNPSCASRYAFRISAGGLKFEPWSVTHGGPAGAANEAPYIKFLPRAARVVERMKSEGYSGIFTEGDARDWTSYDAKDAISDAKGAVDWIAKVFPEVLKRVAFLIVALLLGAGALFIVSKEIR